ncbi:MAG TPA: hypothetical protein VIH78_08720 [Terriglobales bacterium]
MGKTFGSFVARIISSLLGKLEMTIVEKYLHRTNNATATLS